MRVHANSLTQDDGRLTTAFATRECHARASSFVGHLMYFRWPTWDFSLLRRLLPQRIGHAALGDVMKDVAERVQV